MKRADFCENTPVNDSPFWFLPNDFIYRNSFGHTILDIIGINSGGNKTLVRLRNLPIFVDVMINSKTELIIKNEEWVEITQLPGKGFSEPLKWARVFFKNTKTRKSFIENYSKTGFLANNDDFGALLCRYLDFNTCDWNIVSGFKRIKTEKLKYQVEILLDKFAEKFDCIKRYADLPDKLIKDKTIICAWDLETYTDYKYGRVPDPSIPEDKIKMCSMIFKFYWSSEILHKVLITAVPVTIEGVEIIYTQNIPAAFAQVLARMQPDFLTGFNDGGYDWPFMKKRVNSNFLETVSNLQLNSFEKTSFGAMSHTGFPRVKNIKIDPETTMCYDGYLIPGCITFDTAIVLRRINKTETKWSLASFLEKYGIEQKTDMPYETMDKIFHLWQLTTPEEVELIETGAPVFPQDEKLGKNAINKLNKIEILELFSQTNNVGIYCLRDAEACLDLLTKLCIISDVREINNIANTTASNGFYNADGMKVRNCIFSYALKPVWGLFETKYPLAFNGYCAYRPPSKKKEEKTKYKGGHVVPPEKGIFGRTMLEKEFPGVEFEKVNPQSSSFIVKNREEFLEKLIKEKKYSDRPCSGDDFSSLYPSLIMAYNFSPEYYFTKDNQYLEQYKDNCIYIKTHYKKESQEKSSENLCEGYFLKQKSEFKDGKWTYTNHGIFPTILRILFDKRKVIKSEMAVWAIILEKLNRDIRPSIRNNEEITLEKIKEILLHKASQIAKACEKFVGQKRILEENKVKSYHNAYKIIAEKWTNYKDLYSQAIFKFNYYNTKQNAVKVFMNTFYGEMGSADSPFFIIPMSGGVTKTGRRALKSAKSFVENLGFHVYYGDTDSIYISPPHEDFSEVDKKYILGTISKEEYYEEMVGITMTKLTELNVLLTEHFLKLVNCPFLKMEYEEVLFPFGFFGKKNYFGVKHVNSIDFSLCKSPDPKIFLKELFVRGLPIRRRDGSKFIIETLNKLLIDFCSLYETRLYEKIMYDMVEQLWKDTRENQVKYVDKLAKNYSFREPRENSHTAQMIFRERMIDLHKKCIYNKTVHQSRLEGNCIDNDYVVDLDLLQLDFEFPSYGDRADLVLVNRPDVITDRGTKGRTGVGHYLEYPKMLGNKYYAKYVTKQYAARGVRINYEEITLNLRLYFEKLFNKLARFLLYLPENDQSICEHLETKNRGYKEAEKYVIGQVSKKLMRKYDFSVDNIKYDSSALKKDFSIIKKTIISELGTGAMVTLFVKFTTESDFSCKQLKESVCKLWDKPLVMFRAIALDKLNEQQKHMIIYGSRVTISRYIERKKIVLFNLIDSICSRVKKITDFVNEIRECENKFQEIHDYVTTEEHITNIRLFYAPVYSGSEIKNNLDDLLNEFLDI